jgi:hypothetical protein
MTTTQIITIAPDGAVSGLQRKPGQGLNLQSLGTAQTVRASEIAWDEITQAWFIDVLQDAGKGAVTLRRFEMATQPGETDGMGRASQVRLGFLCGGDTGWGTADAETGKWSDDADFATGWYDPRGKLLFRDYDAAVRVEIAFLDALRVRGIF